jgi:hypothetical protein
MATTTIFGAGTLAIGPTASPTDQFECQAGSFIISSTANLIPIPPTLCAAASNAASPSTFGIDLQFMQDWGATPSLSEVLNDADGSTLFFEYVPNDVTVDTATGEFWAVAGDYGGVGQGLWSSQDTMPMVEKPVFTPQA